MCHFDRFVLCSPPQVLSDVPRLSVFPRWEISRTSGGGGAQTSSRGPFQSGTSTQPTHRLATLCSAHRPRQISRKLQVGKNLVENNTSQVPLSLQDNNVTWFRLSANSWDFLFSDYHFHLLLWSRFVVEYCAAHPEAAAVVEAELELSKEMVGLLPLKINRLKARMVTNNWSHPSVNTQTCVLM